MRVFRYATGGETTRPARPARWRGWQSRRPPGAWSKPEQYASPTHCLRGGRSHSKQVSMVAANRSRASALCGWSMGRPLVLELTITSISAMSRRLTMHIGEARCNGPGGRAPAEGVLSLMRWNSEVGGEMNGPLGSCRPRGNEVSVLAWPAAGAWSPGSSGICQPAQATDR